MSPGKKFPDEIIQHWPEVFGEITLNVVPIQYLESITVNFKNKKVWEIKVNHKQVTANWDSFESNLKQMLENYETEIENVDFKLDTVKIKKDMMKVTNKFLKRKKLK